MRNKPKEPPKKPAAAPFFLPTIPGLETKFAPLEEEKKKEDMSGHTISGSLLPLTTFGSLIQKAETEDECEYIRQTCEHAKIYFNSDLIVIGTMVIS